MCCSTEEETASGGHVEVRFPPRDLTVAPVLWMDLLVLWRPEMCICRTPGSVSSVSSLFRRGESATHRTVNSYQLSTCTAQLELRTNTSPT